ncbi:ImmA/IrrE family metallo-endopeptidase [Taklimakanibacter deserti]|uniref:ImmA/IrrE family metallo-endopeptidase n=1 Tax=Taklimakanibacter deserti TaxID=2267839 RepID=UPI000E65750F
MTIRHKYDPDHAAAPGQLIQEHLDHLGISGRELARRCGRSAKLIAEVISGKAAIEPETALQLERVLEIPAVISLTMEAQYRLYLARAEEDEKLASYISWAKSFPLKELSERGHLNVSNKPAVQVRELLQFFGAGSIDACKERFDELLTGTYRHSPSFSSDSHALAAWLRLGDIEADRLNPTDFDRAKFVQALKIIRTQTTEPIERFIPIITNLCAEAGVVFVLERALPKVALSGVSRWLSPRRALIQQTLRHRSNDHFWFTFFHECAHLILHSRKSVFLDEEGKGNAGPELEAQANDWAADFLVPTQEMTRFITRFTYAEEEVMRFASSLGVAPGIIVGQLQHRKVLNYNQMNRLKVRYEWRN